MNNKWLQIDQAGWCGEPGTLPAALKRSIARITPPAFRQRCRAAVPASAACEGERSTAGVAAPEF
mgnify:CR=1 FL=1